MSSVAVEILFYILRVFIHIYDVISLPVYLVLDRPWSQYQRINCRRANPTVKGDPSSPWTTIRKAPITDYENCETLPELIQITVTKHSNLKCFGYRRLINVETSKNATGRTITKKLFDNQYTWLTYAEVDERIGNIALGLAADGVTPGDRVVLIMETRYEWQLFAQALLRIGATVGTLYATLGKEGLIHGINELEARHVVTSADMMATITDIKDKLDHLETVYVVGSDKKNLETENGIKFLSHEVLEENGKNSKTRTLSYKPKGEDVALIMYTSGSTGLPKGVVLTQRQLAVAFLNLDGHLHLYTLNGLRDTYMAYLPLAHIFEFAMEIQMLCYGSEIGFGSPLTMFDASPGLVKGCRGDAVVLKPHSMVMVPLIMDRIKSTVMAKLEGAPLIMQRSFKFFVVYKSFWGDYGFRTPLADKYMFKKTRALLGGRIRTIVSGGAPLSPETQLFIRSILNINLPVGFGATETGGIGAGTDKYSRAIGRVGSPFGKTQLKLVAWEEGNYRPSDKPNPRGEIVLGSENVCAGYFKREAETKEAFEQDSKNPRLRWFKTGDIGEIGADGTLKIIDRKKDLVKLQNGEYISLGKVESALGACTLAENICIFGDSLSNYIIAIVLPNRKVLTETLAGDASDQKWVEICNSQEAQQLVLKEFNELGRASGLNTLEIPKKVKICSDEWTPSNGLLTASLKTRRKQIVEFYKDDIKKLYS